MVTFTEFSAQYAPNGRAKIVYLPETDCPYTALSLMPGESRQAKSCATFKDAALFANEATGADFNPEEEVRHV